MSLSLINILANFEIEGSYLNASIVNTGHINDTYVVDFKSGSGKIIKYVLQRINHNVFKDPDKLMENIIKVTNHIRGKILAEGGDPRRQTLDFIKTRTGKTYYRCKTGDYWRVYSYIE